MKRKISYLGLSIAILINLFPMHIVQAEDSIKIGDYLQMGTYYKEPIIWRCVSFEKISGYEADGTPITDATDARTTYAEGYIPLMMADRILCLKAFDAKGNNNFGSHSRGHNSGESRKNYGSNYWGDSNLRCWLNSKNGYVDWTCHNRPEENNVSRGNNDYANEAGFLTNFTNSELALIKQANHKVLLDGNEYNDMSKYGSSFHTYNSSISNVVQNYRTAYSETVKDFLFLPDVKQIHTIYSNDSYFGGTKYYIGLPTESCVSNSEYKTSDLNDFARWWSWLGSPWTSAVGNSMLYVHTSGDIGKNLAYLGDGGVRPVFYLNLSSFNSKDGDGSMDNPYTICDNTDNSIAVSGVTLNQSEVSLEEEKTETLTATVTPSNATDKTVTWKSSDSSVASVSNGVVTAQKAGTAVITATTTDGGYTASCTVTVTAKPPTVVSVTGITLDKSAIILEEEKIETLAASITPDNATDKTITWKSSDSSVASVSNGVVTAQKAGTAVITATTADGGYTASCTVTVTAKPVDENAPKIKINEVKAKPGNEVDVTIELENNTGFASMGIEVGYNSDIMTLTKVTPNSNVGGTFTPAQAYTVNPFNMGWDSASNITYNGNLATLTFKISDDVADGIYPITIDYYKGRNGNYVDGDDINYDENNNAVEFVYVSGSVTVTSYIPGDINGDEKVNNKDATFLLRYLAGWDADGINTDALDTDGSGTVNNKDATLLLRYLAGWSVTLH